jgi:hypothetical protein
VSRWHIPKLFHASTEPGLKKKKQVARCLILEGWSDVDISMAINLRVSVIREIRERIEADF